MQPSMRTRSALAGLMLGVCACGSPSVAVTADAADAAGDSLLIDSAITDAPIGGDTPLVEIEAARAHTCGVRADGRPVCWGADLYGQAVPPAGPFRMISGGDNHSCGLRVDGSVACWGANGVGQTTAPPQLFSQISVGANHACGVRTADNAIACWGGFNDFGEATPPAGTFRMVSAGKEHSCAVTSAGAVTCWGRNDAGETIAPAGSFEQVSIGDDHSCARTALGAVVCWGATTAGQRTVPAGLVASTIAAGSIPAAPETRTVFPSSRSHRRSDASTRSISPRTVGWSNANGAETMLSTISSATRDISLISCQADYASLSDRRLFGLSHLDGRGAGTGSSSLG